MTEDVRVAFTWFNTATTTDGQEVSEVRWEDFVRKLCEDGFHFPQPPAGKDPAGKEAKLLAPLIVAGTFEDPEGRKNLQNFKEVTIGCLDFDDISQDQLDSLREQIQDKGLAALLYTTWKQPIARRAEKHRVRLMCPLNRAVPRDDWEPVWTGMWKLFKEEADPSCKDPTRGYFAPAAPLGTSEDDIFIEGYLGTPLNVDHLYAFLDEVHKKKPKVSGSSSSKSIKDTTLSSFAKRIKRKSPEIGEALESMLKGEPFATAGNRDNTIYQMCQDLGKAFPNHDPEQIAEKFGPSLSLMSGEDEITVEDVVGKLQRAQEEVLAALEEKKHTAKEIHKTIHEVTGVEKYSKEWAKEFLSETKCGTSVAGLRNRLIVYSKGSYYIFFNGDYQPYGKDGVYCVFKEMVENQVSSLYNDVRCRKVDSNGNDIPMSAQELLNEYGTAATSTRAVLGQRYSYFDEKTRNLVFGKCPINPELVAQRHSQVDDWIDTLCKGKQQAERLRDWLAMCPLTQHRLAMLVLIGRKGLGKTPLFKGLARLWGRTNPVDMSILFEQFGEDIMNCPLLLADEEFPKDHRGRTPSAKIRAVISQGEHLINRKNLPRIEVSGYLRLGAAVNNYEKVESLSVGNKKEDTDALLARMLIIHCNQDAAEKFNGDLFVEGNAIAEHALWLSAQRAAKILDKGSSRTKDSYNIRDNKPDVSCETHLLGKTHKLVLDAVCRFLKTRYNEKHYETPVIVAKRRVFVSPRLLHESWEALFGLKSKRPDYYDFRDSLVDLSVDSITVVNNGGFSEKYVEVSEERLAAYLDLASDLSLDLAKELTLYNVFVVENKYFKLPKTLHPTEEEVQNRAEVQAGTSRETEGQEQDALDKRKKLSELLRQKGWQVLKKTP